MPLYTTYSTHRDIYIETTTHFFMHVDASIYSIFYTQRHLHRYNYIFLHIYIFIYTKEKSTHRDVYIETSEDFFMYIDASIYYRFYTQRHPHRDNYTFLHVYRCLYISYTTQ